MSDRDLSSRLSDEIETYIDGVIGKTRTITLAIAAEPLTDDEMDRIVDGASDTRTALVMSLAGHMGLLCIEMVTQRVEDIDLDRGEMIVRSVRDGYPRTLPIHAEPMARLRAYLAEHPRTEGRLLDFS